MIPLIVKGREITVVPKELPRQITSTPPTITAEAPPAPAPVSETPFTPTKPISSPVILTSPLTKKPTNNVGVIGAIFKGVTSVGKLIGKGVKGIVSKIKENKSNASIVKQLQLAAPAAQQQVFPGITLPALTTSGSSAQAEAFTASGSGLNDINYSSSGSANKLPVWAWIAIGASGLILILLIIVLLKRK